MSKQTLFNDNWLLDSQFKEWIGKDTKNLNKARCMICGGGSFALGNMGKQALGSHAKGKKHCGKVSFMSKNKSEQNVMSLFAKVETTNEENNNTPARPLDQPVQPLEIPPRPPVEHKAGPSSKLKSVSQWITKEDTLRAEVLWALETLSSKYSTNSCVGKNERFSALFPDSEIDKQFQCSKTKCSYLICHGIVPYYQEN